MFDGHFWVVRDGKVIDPYFKEYDAVKRLFGCNGEQVFLPASDAIQKVMLKKIITPIVKQIRSLKENGGDAAVAEVLTEPEYRRCAGNALIEAYKNGGRVVFGSMGWKRNNNKGIHYEFGGENWTIHHFLQDYSGLNIISPIATY